MSRREKWERPNPTTYVVQMEDLTSKEVYWTQDGEQRPVLHGNTLDIRRGESWGFISAETFELELLLQIIGCVRPYGSGKCKLVERGMMRKKRKILPHVFYVGDARTAVPNMNVLEYLMFATQYCGKPAKDRQIELLEIMLKSDCYAWCFAPIKLLSPQERAVLSLLAASFSDALLFIFTYFHKETPPELRHMMAEIANRLRERRAALLIGASDPSVVQDVCSHGAFLIDGEIKASGAMDDLLRRLDKRDYVLRSADAEALADTLRGKLPDYDLRVRGDETDIYHREGGEALEQGELLRVLADTGVPVTDIRTNQRTLTNAFSEVCHDLSHELL